MVFAALPEFLGMTTVNESITRADDATLVASLTELRLMASNLSSLGDTEASAIVAKAANNLVNPHISLANIHASQYFVWGAYFAWGLFILSRLVKRKCINIISIVFTNTNPD